MDLFNEVCSHIREKKVGASFFRADLHAPVSVAGKEDKNFAKILHESSLNIIGLISQNLEQLNRAIELVQKLRSQEVQVYPLLGFWLEIPWPSENIGILVLYEANHSDYKIKKLLEHLGYDENKKLVTKEISIRKIVEIIHSDDGLAFFSPKDSADIQDLQNNKRLFLSLKEDGYDGIETDDEIIARQFTTEKENTAIANLPIFLCSRVKNVRELGRQYTLLKSPEPNFTGIKGAMKDPASRIRYPGDISMAFHKIVGMEIEGNFYKKEVFHFNSNLNCILGGKGAGKTALIELLRFAFNLSSPEEIKKYYLRNDQEFLSFLLGEGIVRVWIKNNKGRSFVIVRSLQDEESHIYTSSGEEIATNITSGEMFSLDILGWSEIEYRAQNPHELLKMLDISSEETKNVKQEIKELKKDIYKLGEELVKVRQNGALNLKKLKELLGKKEELNALKKTEFSKLIENYEVRYKREFLLDKCIQKFIEFEESFKKYFEQDPFLQFKKQFASLSSPYIQEINQLLKDSHQRFRSNMEFLHNGMDHFLEVIHDTTQFLVTQKSILVRLHEKETALNLREKKKYGKEIQQVIKKLSDLALAINSIPEIKQLQLKIQDQYSDLRQKMSLKVSRLKELMAKQEKLRGNIQSFINKKLGPDIQMDFIPFYKTLPIQDFSKSLCSKLEDQKLGIKIQDGIENLGVDLINLLDFNWINEGEELSEGFDLNKREIKPVRTFLLKNYAHLLQLAIQNIDSLPELRFRNKPVHQLSSGQRCTTVLPVLFLLGNHPLIIDQPEDNLDNSYIFNQIVQPIRKELKGHRQIILVTHNPNIPVSGDAEKIFLLEADDTHGWVKEGGYIEEGKIPVEIQNILEGGKEAFGLRLQKYGY